MLMLTEQEKQELKNCIDNSSPKPEAKSAKVLSFDQYITKRAKIILSLAQGKDINTIHQELKVSPETIQRWEKRWRERSKESDVAKRLANEKKSSYNYKRLQEATTGINAIFGQWPGDESDEELEKFLEQLS